MAANVESMFYVRDTVAWVRNQSTGSTNIEGCVDSGRIRLACGTGAGIYRSE